MKSKSIYLSILFVLVGVFSFSGCSVENPTSYLENKSTCDNCLKSSIVGNIQIGAPLEQLDSLNEDFSLIHNWIKENNFIDKASVKLDTILPDSSGDSSHISLIAVYSERLNRTDSDEMGESVTKQVISILWNGSVRDTVLNEAILFDKYLFYPTVLGIDGVKIKGNAQIYGDVFANSDVYIEDASAVYGDVYCGLNKEVFLRNRAQVVGEIYELPLVTFLDSFSIESEYGEEDIIVKDDTLELEIGNHYFKNVVILGKGVLIITEGGKLFCKSLEIRGHGKLLYGRGSEIYIDEYFNVVGNARIVPFKDVDNNVLITYLMSEGNVRFGGNGGFDGILIGSKSSVVLDGSFSFKGRILARNVLIKGNVTFVEGGEFLVSTALIPQAILSVEKTDQDNKVVKVVPLSEAKLISWRLACMLAAGIETVIECYTAYEWGDPDYWNNVADCLDNPYSYLIPILKWCLAGYLLKMTR